MAQGKNRRRRDKVCFTIEEFYYYLRVMLCKYIEIQNIPKLVKVVISSVKRLIKLGRTAVTNNYDFWGKD